MEPVYRVLYVDDETALLDIGKIFLERTEKFMVDTAPSAQIGLEKIKGTSYDTIISDYQMPDMDGIEFLKIVRATNKLIPFIIFTGKGREEIAIKAFEHGADYYLQKGGQPMAQFAELAHKITKAVQHRLDEKALRESEARYRNVVEDQTEFISRFLPDGTHIFVNEAYCRYFNVPRDAIIGHKFTPVIPHEDQPLVREHFTSLTRENPTTIVTHRIIMPDGNVRWQRWSDRAIFDEEGTLIEYQSVGRDISDQKEMEEALRDSKDTLNAIVRGSPIPQFVIDRKHRVIHWNETLEKYSGIKAEEIIGTNQQWKAFYQKERPCMADLLVDDKTETIPQWYEGRYAKSKLIEGGYEATGFFPHMGQSGTWLYFTAAPIRNSGGSVIGAVETLEDITERKRVEEALRQANRQLNLLGSITRHDILNKVTIILGYICIIKAEFTDPALGKYIRELESATNAIQSQIKFTRVYQDLGSQEPRWQELDRTLPRPHVPATILLTADVQGIEVYADPMLVQVFSNLLDNSIRHGERVTEIRVSSSQASDGLTVVWEDNGVGIAADEKEKIFERGYGKDTGLGLFLVREVLSLTGITITETGVPGIGARFEISVPKRCYRFSGMENQKEK